MLLCVDIGNTNIVLGIKNGNQYNTCRFKTKKNESYDYYLENCKSFLDDNHFDNCIISSVVPSINNVMEKILYIYNKECPLIINPLMKASFHNEIEEPTSLGADLFTTAEGAVKLYGPGVIIVDMGTATKLMVVDKNYQFLGGAICAGMKKGLSTLFESAELLESFNVDSANKVVGGNTRECIESGYIFGNASMIDGMITRIKKELGTELKVVLTGGLSKKVKPYLNHDTIFVPDLIFIGMESLYEQNCKE